MKKNLLLLIAMSTLLLQACSNNANHLEQTVKEQTVKSETVTPIKPKIADTFPQDVQRESAVKKRIIEPEPTPDMMIDINIYTHTIYISGGLELNTKAAYLANLEEDAKGHYRMAGSAYPNSIACDFENGSSTEFTARPKQMNVEYKLKIYSKGKVVGVINERWIAGSKGEVEFARRIEI